MEELKDRKSFLKKRVEASALLFAIFLSIILLLLISLTFLLINYQDQQVNSIVKIHQQFEAVESGYSLIEKGRISPNIKENGNYKLFKDENEIIKIEFKDWGVLKIANITNLENKNVVKKSALLCSNEVQDPTSIYLLSERYPLTLVGESKIQGNIYTPILDACAGSIAWVGFHGDKLIDGLIFHKKDVPIIDMEILNMSKFNEIVSNFPHHSINEYFYSSEAIIVNSFFQDPLIIELEELSDLRNISINGNVILICPHPLFITKSAKLHDIIVLCEDITFETGFVGNLQVFSKGDITLMDDTQLKYPSALLCNESNPDKGIIRCMRNSKFEGDIFSNSTFSSQPSLSIEVGASISGTIFIKGFVDHKGIICGILIANAFIHNENSRLYFNYLVNGEVSFDSRPNAYFPSYLFSGKQSGKRTKWLF